MTAAPLLEPAPKPLSAIHLPALDGLRAIAILLVLFFHFEIRELPKKVALLPVWATVQAGWLGVDLFFVLSGFLITGILCDTRETRGYFRNFYARRTLRILPLQYGFLALSFLVLPILGVLPWTPASTQAWFWLHLSNFLIAFRGWGASQMLVPHFWSLAVEEQFYLVWPALVFLVSRPALRRICVACVVVSLAVRVGLRYTTLPWYACLAFTPARLDALGLGALLAILMRGGTSAPLVARHAGWAALVTGGLCAALFVWRGFANGEDAVIATVGMTSFDVFAACGVAVAITAPAWSLPVRLLSRRWLQTIGRYSYGMYVVHLGVLKLVIACGLSIAALTRRFGAALGHLVHLSVGLGATFLLAALSYHLYEQPFLRLKARFAPGPARSR
jgi:peptidoglycan/LPS O-acetylase OafA/YrhL